MGDMPWVVLVTGSRHWTDPEPLIEFLKRFEVAEGIGPTLLHGDCTGLDRLAADLVTRSSRPWLVHAFPAPFKALGKKAGPRRNQLMVNTLIQYSAAGYRTAIGAFPVPDSVGTWNCVSYANEMGFKPEVWHP